MHPELRSWFRRSGLTLGAVGLLFMGPLVAGILGGGVWEGQGKGLIGLGLVLAAIFGFVSWLRSRSAGWYRELSARMERVPPKPGRLLSIRRRSAGRGHEHRATIVLPDGSMSEDVLLELNVRHAKKLLRREGPLDIRIWSSAEGAHAFTLPDGRLMVFRPPEGGFWRAEGRTRALLLPPVVYAALVLGSALWHLWLGPHVEQFVESAEGVELALTLGRDPNRSKDGMPLLHHAVQSGREEIARVLLSGGADVELQDRLGRTPLILAVNGSRPVLTRLLLEHGADPDGPNSEALPLARALERQRPELIRLLLEHGSDPAKIEDTENSRRWFRRLGERDQTTWKLLADRIGRKIPGSRDDPPEPFPDYQRAPTFDPPPVPLPKGARTTAVRSTGAYGGARREDHVTFLSTESIAEVAAFYARSFDGAEVQTAPYDRVTTVTARLLEDGFRGELRVVIDRSRDGETTRARLYQLRER